MKKNILISLFLISILFLNNGIVMARELRRREPEIKVEFTIEDPDIKVNGNEVQIDEIREIYPIIEDGVIMVPIRFIVEPFDVNVEWNNTTKTAILTKNNRTIQLTADFKYAYVNGTRYSLPASPFEYEDRIFVPVYFVLDRLNLRYNWNRRTETMTITNYYERW